MYGWFVGLVTTLMLLAAGMPVRAADIYINGQQVRGITNLSLDNCAVTFNARGDIYITAPDFKVLPTAAKGQESTTVGKTVSLLANRYFMFTQTNAPGKVPYRFKLLVNDHEVKEFTSSQDKLTVELTLHLKKGQNKIEVKSFYQATAGGSPADSFTIFVGRGAPVEGSLEINKLLLNYARKGSDSGDSADVFHIDAE